MLWFPTILAMISALEKADNDQTCRQELTKASERLGKVLSETDIRLLIRSMVQKNGADMYAIFSTVIYMLFLHLSRLYTEILLMLQG